MARGAQGSHGVGYVVAAAMLVLALLFPIGLMIFNPTLMFERGWEQYVGTGIYLWAVLTLGRELLGLWRNERAFEEAPDLLRRVKLATSSKAAGAEAVTATEAAAAARSRFPTRSIGILPRRVRQLVSYIRETRSPSVTQLMEVNREGSGLDQEQVAGRFTLDAVHPLPAAGDRLHRHGRGDLAGLDEHQQGAADGQGARRVPVEPDGRDGGLADRLRQHAAGPVPERRLDAGADPGLPPLGGAAGPGGPLGRRARPAAGRATTIIRWWSASRR